VKIPLDIPDFDEKLLEMNGRQVRAVRHESESVKNCFTNQAHQTMLVSAAIIGLSVKFMSNEDFSWVVVGLGSFFVSILCLVTAGVGIHKYSTANRNTGFQIHLARVIDYSESNKIEKRLANELRRIDWEEAMFAWRIVQQSIYTYFYGTTRRLLWIPFLGIPFIKYRKRPDDCGGHFEKLKAYPWFDTE